MFENLKPLTVLPVEIQRDFQGIELHRGYETEAGIFRLVGIRRTAGMSAEGQRIKALVIDENNFPVSNVTMAFSFSTAIPFVLTPDYLWMPPYPHRAVLTRTDGGGETDLVLGAEGVIKDGERGGVTVYALEPNLASDAISGAGMLADHSGLHLTFQLRRTGVLPFAEWLSRMEERVARLEEAAGL